MIAQEIVDDLQAALNEFAVLAEVLEAATVARHEGTRCGVRGSRLPVLSVSGCSVLFVSVRQSILEDLASIPPGPELARVLAGLELSRLSGYDCVEVLKARYRQLNHERARVMAAMVEVGLCGIGPDEELRRMAVPDEFSPDEIRAALVLTRRAAQSQFWLAYDLVSRLPQVHAAMDAGALDEPRARVFSEWTTELSPEQARAVCAALMPQAPTLTTGQLIEQIKKLAIAVDPDWARRRYEQAVANRKVVGYRNADGSANLSGCNLPLDRVAAASGRIDALAKAARRAGDTRPLDHIRAELFLGMTDGTYTGLDDTAIIDHLRTTTPASEADQPERGEGTHDDKPDSSEPGEGGPDESGSDDDGSDADGSDADGSDADGSGDDGSGDDGSGDGDAAGEARSPALGDGPIYPPRAGVGAGVELRVRLSTLLGQDQYPAELAGWGPLHAELARDLATSLGGAQWRFALTDAQGQLTHCGITQARPTGTPNRIAGCRAIVELQVPGAALRALVTHPAALGRWAGVVADLTRQLDHDIPGEDRYRADAGRRTPGAVLRRYLEIRDRYCIMIGCRAPAHRTDKDHTRDHAQGGPTIAGNLGDACRHDHRLKHEGGWQLHQPEPGVFRWTSRLGHTYDRQLPAIIEPLPDPLPHDQPSYPRTVLPDDDWENSSIWDEPLPEPKPDPPPEPNPHDDDIPPF